MATALALPVLATSLDQMIGFAIARLDVKTLAHESIGPRLTITAKSLPDFFRPAAAPAATKPLGYVTLMV
jgi:hypothetical protein